MSLLVERVMPRMLSVANEHFDADEREQMLVGRVPVFEITNVADLAYRMDGLHSGSTGNIQLHVDRFPNIGPPVKSYWMEWRPPAPLDTQHTIGRFGVWCIVTANTTDEHWHLSCALWTMRGKEPRATGRFELTIDRTGGIVKDPGRIDVWPEAADELLDNTFSRPTGRDRRRDDVHHEWLRDLDRRLAGLTGEARDAALSAEHDRLDGDERAATAKIIELRQQAADIVGDAIRIGVLPPLLLTHSLLGCKNVDTEQHRPNPKLVKAARKRSADRAKVTFKTLVIRPMGGGAGGPAARTQIGDGQTALHLVRGHFKTFTADRPLLGKHVGTYWWSPAVRGNAEHGTVVNDYQVQT